MEKEKDIRNVHHDQPKNLPLPKTNCAVNSLTTPPTSPQKDLSPPITPVSPPQLLSPASPTSPVSPSLLPSPTSSQQPENYSESTTQSPVYVWRGWKGEIGLQTFPILSTFHLKSVAAGGGHVLFLTECGKVFTQGQNAHGQLGLGESYLGQDHKEPVIIDTLKGKLFSCCLK